MRREDERRSGALAELLELGGDKRPERPPLVSRDEDELMYGTRSPDARQRFDEAARNQGRPIRARARGHENDCVDPILALRRGAIGIDRSQDDSNARVYAGLAHPAEHERDCLGPRRSDRNDRVPRVASPLQIGIVEPVEPRRELRERERRGFAVGGASEARTDQTREGEEEPEETHAEP